MHRSSNNVDNNDSNYNEEFSKFIRDLAFSLKVENVLEVGCSTGNDLRAFPENFDVHGIDLNDHALNKARLKLRSFKFKKGSIIDEFCALFNHPPSTQIIINF